MINMLSNNTLQIWYESWWFVLFCQNKILKNLFKLYTKRSNFDDLIPNKVVWKVTISFKKWQKLILNYIVKLNIRLHVKSTLSRAIRKVQTLKVYLDSTRISLYMLQMLSIKVSSRAQFVGIALRQQGL